MADNCPRPSIQYEAVGRYTAAGGLGHEAAMTGSLIAFLLVFVVGMIVGYGLRSEVTILRRERARRKF
jgi:hypothetical protein